MKKIYFILLSLILVTSCSKNFVDVKPLGNPTTAFFWHTPDDINRATNAMYANMSSEQTFGQNIFFMQGSVSDDVVVGRNDDGEAVALKNLQPQGNGSGYYSSTPWQFLYSAMASANWVIAGIDQATVSSDLKNRAKGEAYFMRGFDHFWLAYIWGSKDQGVPFDGPENPLYQKRVPPQLPSVIDNYKQIISDLQKAANLLPIFQSYSPSDYGRAHKAAAWAYMAKTYTYWAQYDNTKWALIPALCDSITNVGGRSLLPDYKSVFTIPNNWSSEYIWAVNAGPNGGSEFPGISLENQGWGQFNGWGYCQPTEELYEEYEPGDPRREATILKFGDTFTYFGVARQYWSTNSPTGFQQNKFMEPYSYGTGTAGSDMFIGHDGNYPFTYLNFPLMRYAEILLLKAEALIQMNQNAAAAAPLNLVRNRAGLPSIAAPTMADLKHERRVELAIEWSDRYMDLKRWGDYDKINQPLHGRIHADKTNPSSPYTIQEVWPARHFTAPKNLVWPINPQEIALSNGAYKQNAGW